MYIKLNIFLHEYVNFWKQLERNKLREKCPYLEFFWSVFSRIRTEYEEILWRDTLVRKDTLHLIGMRE